VTGLPTSKCGEGIRYIRVFFDFNNYFIIFKNILPSLKSSWLYVYFAILRVFGTNFGSKCKVRGQNWDFKSSIKIIQINEEIFQINKLPIFYMCLKCTTFTLVKISIFFSKKCKWLRRGSLYWKKWEKNI